jgi:hypothetical protein
MMTIEQMRRAMYPNAGSKEAWQVAPKAAPQRPSAPRTVANRAEAGKLLYELSNRPFAEQKHYQAANALFAAALVKAADRGDRQRVRYLEKVRDQAAAASFELGLTDSGTRRFLSGIAHSVGNPKTRGELTAADDASLTEKFGTERAALAKLATERTGAVLKGEREGAEPEPKAELHEVLFNSDAPVHLDVIEPVFEAVAAARESTPTQS